MLWKTVMEGPDVVLGNKDVFSREWHLSGYVKDEYAG